MSRALKFSLRYAGLCVDLQSGREADTRCKHSWVALRQTSGKPATQIMCVTNKPAGRPRALAGAGRERGAAAVAGGVRLHGRGLRRGARARVAARPGRGGLLPRRRAAELQPRGRARPGAGRAAALGGRVRRGRLLLPERRGARAWCAPQGAAPHPRGPCFCASGRTRRRVRRPVLPFAGRHGTRLPPAGAWRARRHARRQAQHAGSALADQ